MSVYLSHQPTDLDPEVNSPWVWKIHINPFAGPDVTLDIDLTDEEMRSIVDDYHLILEREAEE